MTDNNPAMIDEALEQAALEPKRVTVAGQSVELPSIPELIEAKREQARDAAAAVTSLGVRYQRMERTYE